MPIENQGQTVKNETSVNADSMMGQGEFAPKVPPSVPSTSGGHQVGKQVGNDAAPEFHAQTLPAGSAPASKTYQPNPVGETPGQGLNPNAGAEGRTSAQDTLVGATSQDVNAGLGKPYIGQTHDDVDGKVERSGGQNATGAKGQRNDGDDNISNEGIAGGRDRMDINAAANDQKFGSSLKDAGDRLPETADTVSSEAPAS